MTGKLYDENALANLRAAMKDAGVDYYLMVSTDAHASEYISDHFKVTEFVSGCTSDNAVLIVGADEAGLWTDGRYFISAAAELDGTGIDLMKSGEKDVPAVEAFLKEKMSQKEPSPLTQMTLAFDGHMISAADGKRYRKAAEEGGFEVRGGLDLITPVWKARPELPVHPVTILPEEVAGSPFEEKLKDLRDDLAECGADGIMLSKLDDIMWLFNIRGADIDYNPVALAYAFVTQDTCTLFLQETETDDGLLAYAKEKGFSILPYEDALTFAGSEPGDGSPAQKMKVLCDPSASSDAMLQLLKKHAEVLEKGNPTEIRKAVKNGKEMELIRKYYLLDSVAVCKFIFYVKKMMRAAAVNTSQKEPSLLTHFTEMDAARKLDSLRAEIPGFLGLSFPTIPAYGANAAMAHYAPEGEGAPVEPEGFLLVDSGGQYMGATTDVTRTIAVGHLTEEMKRDFTLVAAGHFRLMNAVFKEGTVGSSLDYLARLPLYGHGMDFNHGTGHGIGYILNVHEGPQRIGKVRKGGSETPFVPGMLTSDEPGIYRENEYGIRTESITLTVPYKETEFGAFYKFECLTWAPVDRDAIDPAYLTSEDLAAINAYHAEVYEKISPYLDGEELAYLFEATRPL